jgi:SAM-dependent methyltransferase
VLDAGCGTGAFTRAVWEVAGSDARYHAFDLTPAMIAHLEAWALERGVEVAARVADVTRLDELPPEWRDFDLLVSSAMLEYLAPEALPAVLASLARRLGPGGTMIVCITRRNLLMRGLIGVLWQSNLYSRAAIEWAFVQAGLTPRFLAFPGVYAYLGVWGHVIEVKAAPRNDRGAAPR